MNKKNLIICMTVGAVVFLALLAIILYNEIPRLVYTYDAFLDGYVITNSYGHVKTYDIKANYKGKEVVGIGRDAFKNKDSLEYIDLSETNIKKIAVGAFYDADNLKQIVFPTTIESIANNAFFSCDSLTAIDLSQTNLTNLGGSVFFDNISLLEVKLPSGLKVIGSYAFYNTNLELLEIYSLTILEENALLGVKDEALNIINEE